MFSKAIEKSNSIILVGDLSKDQLNPLNNEFYNKLNLNNMRKVVTAPTRVTQYSSTLIDLIAISNQINLYDADTFKTDLRVSDHFATQIHIKIDFTFSPSFKRRV